MGWGWSRSLAVAVGAIALAIAGCQLLVDTSGLSSGGPPTDAGQAIGVDGPGGPNGPDGGIDGCTPAPVGPPDAGPIVPLDPRWVLLGSAVVEGAEVTITGAKTWQSGAIWWNEPVQLDDFHVTAAIKIYAPSSYIADGFAFAWVRGTFPALGDGGSGLGIGELDGYAVVIDLFQNSQAGEGVPFIALVDTRKPWTERGLVARTLSVAVTDDVEHVLSVTLRSGVVSVSLDDLVLIDRFVIPDYVPVRGWWGFTATTGNGIAVQRLVRAAIATADCP